MTTSASASGARPWIGQSVRQSEKSESLDLGKLQQRLYQAMGATAVVIVLAVGWWTKDVSPLKADQGLGYALGILAVTCMLVLLLYPLRKRFRALGFLGSVRHWFRTHMMLGILAPVAALYHCGFQVGSLNSQVALYSALLVAASGLFGRFLYRKIHQTLYGRKTDLKKLRKEMSDDKLAGDKLLNFLHVINSRTAELDKKILDSGTGVWSSLIVLPGIRKRTQREKQALLYFADQRIHRGARFSPLLREHRLRLLTSLDAYLDRHMQRLHELAKLQAYEQLFALWHLAHLPFFILLLISVTVHVLAVHLY